MALSQADRIAFSLNIVSAPIQAASIDANKAALQAQAVSIQGLDTANANLMAGPNTLINLYQPELSYFDGNVRTTIVEQDIQDAANKTLGNHFFPNNTAITVPSLSAKNNVWPQTAPYALTYAIGKNYTEGYGVFATTEPSVITTMLGYTTTSAVADITATVNQYLTLLTGELAVIPTTDTNATNKTNNQAAVSNIGVIQAALNAYLAATHPAPPAPVTPPAMPTPTTPDPSVTILLAAVTARQTFIATRQTQLTTILGSITQDVSSGSITASSGAYAQRYNALALRLNSLSGSLSQLASLNAGIAAQTSLKTSMLQNAATYGGFVPTSILKSDANNLNTIHAVNPSLFSVGDTVYIFAEGQSELLRAIASINNDVITLNDVVPAKFTVSTNARIYKDAT